MGPQPRRETRRDQRGNAISVYVLGAISGLIMIAGLVVDGGQKAHAISRAESVAAGAARAAANAGAGSTIAPGSAGGLRLEAAEAAAQAYLTAAGTAGAGQPQISGSVQVQGTRVRIDTQATVPTIFLSVIGIDTLIGTGQATAQVVPNQ